MVCGFAQRRSVWSVLALNALIDLLVHVHFRNSLEPDADFDPLWGDLFAFRRRDESGRAVLGEMQWRGENTQLDDAARDRAVGDLITLIGMLSGPQYGRIAAALAPLFNSASIPGVRNAR